MFRLFAMCVSALDIMLAIAIFLTWRIMGKDKSCNLAVVSLEVSFLASALLLIFSQMLYGLSPSGKAHDFDSCMRWFESNQPSLVRFICLTKIAYHLCYSSSFILPPSGKLIKEPSQGSGGFLVGKPERVQSSKLFTTSQECLHGLCYGWWIRTITVKGISCRIQIPFISGALFQLVERPPHKR